MLIQLDQSELASRKYKQDNALLVSQASKQRNASALNEGTSLTTRSHIESSWLLQRKGYVRTIRVISTPPSHSRLTVRRAMLTAT